MSYMSLFEKSARNSVAVSLLNKMRHWLQGRQQEGLSAEEQQVLQEALDIMESRQFEQMVIHSFQGVSSGLAASVLPISMALRAATDNDNQKTSGLKKLLSSNRLPEDQSEKDSYIELLNQAIQTIGNLDLEVGHNRIIKSQYKGL